MTTFMDDLKKIKEETTAIREKEELAKFNRKFSVPMLKKKLIKAVKDDDYQMICHCVAFTHVECLIERLKELGVPGSSIYREGYSVTIYIKNLWKE